MNSVAFELISVELILFAVCFQIISGRESVWLVTFNLYISEVLGSMRDKIRFGTMKQKLACANFIWWVNDFFIF